MRILFTRLLIGVFFLPYLLFSQQAPDLNALDTYIAQAVEDFEAPGLAIAIVKDGEVVFEKAYGYRDVGKKIPLESTDLFNIASCSKAFTAACIGILAAEGKLSWKDKVIDHIPEFRLADPYITSHMNLIDLLSHRSGLTTFTGDLLWYGSSYTNKEVIERMAALPIENDFRGEYGYQNNMFMIAGEIVERVSGQSWSDFVQTRIFDPLKMEESRTASKFLKKKQAVALPHLKRQAEEIQIYEPGPAFSIYASASELTHWLQMWLNQGQWNDQEVLTPQTIQGLHTPRTLMRVSNWAKSKSIHFRTYGLGWYLYDYGGRTVAEHGGGMPGYISKVCMVPEENLGIVVLTNGMNSLPTVMMYRVLDLYLKAEPHDFAAEFLRYKKGGEAGEKQAREARLSKRQEGTSPSLADEAYVGLYRDRYYGDARVEMKEGKLWLTFLPTADLFNSEMTHWHHDTWEVKFADEFLPEGYVTFSFDSDAQITGFKIDLPNPDFHFYKLDFQRIAE